MELVRLFLLLFATQLYIIYNILLLTFCHIILADEWDIRTKIKKMKNLKSCEYVYKCQNSNPVSDYATCRNNYCCLSITNSVVSEHSVFCDVL